MFQSIPFGRLSFLPTSIYVVGVVRRAFYKNKRTRVLSEVQPLNRIVICLFNSSVNNQSCFL